MNEIGNKMSDHLNMTLLLFKAYLWWLSFECERNRECECRSRSYPFVGFCSHVSVENVLMQSSKDLK